MEDALFRYIISLFDFFKSKSGEIQTPTDVISEESCGADTVPQTPEVTVQIPEKQNVVSADSAYIHVNRRLYTRYHLYITWAEYLQWISDIQNDNAIKIADRDGGALYCIRYKGKPIFVVYVNNIIITALTPKIEYRKILNSIEFEAQEKLKAENERKWKEIQFYRKLRSGSQKANQVGASNRKNISQHTNNTGVLVNKQEVLVGVQPTSTIMERPMRVRGKAKDIGKNR